MRAEQAAGVRRLVREQVAAAERLEAGAVHPVLEVLLEARRELQRDLTKWLATVDDATERFTAHHMRVMLRSLEGTLDKLGIDFKRFVDGKKTRATKLERALLEGLDKGRHATGALSVKMLEQEIVKLGHIFEQSIVAPQLDVAAVLARGDHLLFKRQATSAARYGRKVAEDLRFQISVGVARGETFEQLVQRLRRMGGPTGPVAVRGIMGHPGAIVEDIPEGLFVRYRYFAERIVRTEMMRAYNVQHEEGIRQLNEQRAPGEPKWIRRWDSTADGRRCAQCRYLDGKLAPIGGLFPDGIDAPPAHPNCRCIVLAWREDWPEDAGEISPHNEGDAIAHRHAV